MNHNVYRLMRLSLRNKLNNAKPAEKVRTPEDAPFYEGECKMCGTKLLQHKYRRRRIYCSDKCRTEYLCKDRKKDPEPCIKEAQNNCKYCGTEIVQTKGHRARKFCSDTCRSKWWGKAYTRNEDKRTHTYTCALCGKVFKSNSTKSRKYCSRECYYRDRFE